MICPILEIGWMQTKVGEKGVSSDCLKEECAWWVENAQRCSIRCNAESLGQVALMAKSLRKKVDIS